MDHYKNYGTEDFIWDTFFRQWVLSPTRETDMQWKEWLSANPEMSVKVGQARTVVLSLRVNEPKISNLEIADVVRETVLRTAISSWNPSVTPVRTIPFYKRTWFRIAASFMLLLVAGMLAKSRFSEEKLASIEKRTVKVEEPAFVEKVNITSSPEMVLMADGSRITLMPKSKIYFARKFVTSKREVYLTGEAFFDIAKDPQRPFFVYAKTLVTKVLGTSFTIKAYEIAREVTVEVSTGRVSVFAQSDPNLKEKTTNRELEGVVLSPNQKIIYSGDHARMVKTLVEKPRIVIPKKQVPEFIFEDVPVSEVFNAIARAYGIDILYDEELLKGCPLTAILENQTLHEKLTIICKAIEANYEILDGQIVIHGKGCRN